MAALVTLADFEAWIGEDLADPAESARAQAYLVSASALVRSYTGRTWVDVDGNPTTVPDEVATVVKQVAERKWLNPSGIIQESVGPMSARRPERAGNGLYLSDDDKLALGAYRVTPSGLWTQGITKNDPLIDAATRDALYNSWANPESDNRYAGGI